MKRGFTLIELLVAIAIFFILTSFVVIKYWDNEGLRYLRGDAQMLTDDLQKIQNMALAGESVNDVLPDYYNLYFKSCESDCSYITFASTTDEVFEIATKNLKYASIDTGVSGEGEIMVAFRLPRGRMIIYTRGGTVDEAKINISDVSGKNNFCLQLNSISGRIGLISGDCI